MRAGLGLGGLRSQGVDTDERSSETCRLACQGLMLPVGWVIDSVGF